MLVLYQYLNFLFQDCLAEDSAQRDVIVTSYMYSLIPKMNLGMLTKTIIDKNIFMMSMIIEDDKVIGMTDTGVPVTGRGGQGQGQTRQDIEEEKEQEKIVLDTGQDQNQEKGQGEIDIDLSQHQGKGQGDQGQKSGVEGIIQGQDQGHMREMIGILDQVQEKSSDQSFMEENLILEASQDQSHPNIQRGKGQGHNPVKIQNHTQLITVIKTLIMKTMDILIIITLIMMMNQLVIQKLTMVVITEARNIKSTKNIKNE